MFTCVTFSFFSLLHWFLLFFVGTGSQSSNREYVLCRPLTPANRPEPFIFSGKQEEHQQLVVGINGNGQKEGRIVPIFIRLLLLLPLAIQYKLHIRSSVHPPHIIHVDRALQQGIYSVLYQQVIVNILFSAPSLEYVGGLACLLQGLPAEIGYLFRVPRHPIRRKICLRLLLGKEHAPLYVH